MDGEINPQEPFSENPSGHAYLTITPTTVVPASQTHMVLMSVTGIAGIVGAVLTAYIAAHAAAREFDWLLGFAVAELALAALAELALALTVALRLRTARNYGVRRRKARLLSRARPFEGSPGEGAGC
jgi:hypothetical protein